MTSPGVLWEVTFLHQLQSYMFGIVMNVSIMRVLTWWLTAEDVPAAGKDARVGLSAPRHSTHHDTTRSSKVVCDT